MNRLTARQHWDKIWSRNDINKILAAQKRRSRINKKWPLFYSYSDYLLENVVLEKMLRTLKGGRVLEVGSSPGTFLVMLNKRFSLVPYGVEYSESGVTLNKKIFCINGLNPENIIYADFFADDFHLRYKESFDVVVSRGFIEHFTNTNLVIDMHLHVLKEGGILIVSIPNLHVNSIYRRWANHYDRERLVTHNLDIMSEDKFCCIFNRSDLKMLFSGYFGTCRLSNLGTANSIGTRIVISACHRIQRFIDPILHLLFRNKGFEGPKFSPILLYVGRKNNNMDR